MSKKDKILGKIDNFKEDESLLSTLIKLDIVAMILSLTLVIIIKINAPDFWKEFLGIYLNKTYHMWDIFKIGCILQVPLTIGYIYSFPSTKKATKEDVKSTEYNISTKNKVEDI